LQRTVSSSGAYFFLRRLEHRLTNRLRFVESTCLEVGLHER